MTFDRNDFDFDDFDDDSFDVGDDSGDLDFGDDAGDFNFDDDADFGFEDEPVNIGDEGTGSFGFEDEDMPVLEDEGDGGGFNRNFIILAAVMIALFVVGLILVVFLALRPTGPTDIDLTVTARVAANSTVGAQLAETQTAQPTINAQMTLTAQVTATFTREPTFTPTATTPPPPTLDQTQVALNAQLTQTSVDATQTAAFLLTPPTMEQPDQNAVALTATALATLLQPPQETPGQGGGIPTAEIFTPIGGAIPTALPDTGLFDDLGSGGSMGLIALLGLGLVGIIVVSRRVRSSVSK
ncbi:MAG: hypothetical protein H6672_19770 [Anaerolineaceae bacterium]|nr:hypothetical protein [Anaerolineaceae bacterium]